MIPKLFHIRLRPYIHTCIHDTPGMVWHGLVELDRTWALFALHSFFLFFHPFLHSLLSSFIQRWMGLTQPFRSFKPSFNPSSSSLFFFLQPFFFVHMNDRYPLFHFVQFLGDISSSSLWDGVLHFFPAFSRSGWAGLGWVGKNLACHGMGWVYKSIDR